MDVPQGHLDEVRRGVPGRGEGLRGAPESGALCIYPRLPASWVFAKKRILTTTLRRKIHGGDG